MLSLIRTTLLLVVAALATNIPAEAKDKPLRVYILAGQSNMVGTGAISSLDYLGEDPKTAPLLKRILDADGEPRTCDRVWISSLNGKARTPGGIGQGKLSPGYGVRRDDPTKPGDCIGPEYTFGLTMEDNYDGPILLIKTAWGGHSLHVEYRPPSAGDFVMPEERVRKLQAKGANVLADKQAELKEFTGKYYQRMIDHVRTVLADIKQVVPEYDPSAGYEVAGFVWFQGWNDMVGRDVYPNRDKAGGYDLYTKLLTQFIRDVRKDLSSPQMPFVIGVMGVGGPVDEYGPDQQRYKSVHQNFRDAMAAPASLDEFDGNVAAVLTENYWDAELDELKTRGGKVRAKSQELNKDKSLSREQREAALAKFRSELYTPHELEVLKGSSNAGYHYNGSAKIMAQIGKGFAEAITGMQEGNE